MSMRQVWSTRGWLVFAASTLVAVLVLIAFGLRQISLRTFSLGVANQVQVAVVRPGHVVCQGPITTPLSAREAGIWGDPVTGAPLVTVAMWEAGARHPLAHGRVVPALAGEWKAELNRDISAGRPVEVCLRARLGSFSLMGGSSVAQGVRMTGGQHGKQFSLVLRRPSGQSLLGSLPRAFARASLFKLSWVGPWTFWLLCGLLLTTIVFGSVAISAAARDDKPTSDQEGVDDPGRGSPD